MRIGKTLFLFVLLSVAAFARGRDNGHCMAGGKTVSTVGQNSTNFVMQSYKGCTVTVYITGTLNLATIYSDDSGTPKANPFTADSQTGDWFYYADDGTYDVKNSGGGIPTPFTRGGRNVMDPYLSFPGTSNRRLASDKAKDIINVKDYGALCDGSHDDTSAIQAALDQAATDNTVMIPPGRCVVSSTLLYDSSIQGQYWFADSPDIGLGTGSEIYYTGTGTALRERYQLYGIHISGLRITLHNNTINSIGIDIRLGGSDCTYDHLFIAGDQVGTDAAYGIYLRGINPGTGLSNNHEAFNTFNTIHIGNGISVGIRLGDDISNGLALANTLLNFFGDGSSTYAIEIVGAGNTLVAPQLSTFGIHFLGGLFGAVTGNTIIGAEIESMPTIVTIDVASGQSPVFNAFGCLNLVPNKVLDNVEPNNPRRFTIMGNEGNMIAALYNRITGVEKIGFDMIGNRLIVNGTHTAYGGPTGTTLGVGGSVGFVSTYTTTDLTLDQTMFAVTVNCESNDVTITLPNTYVVGARIYLIKRLSPGAHIVTIVPATGKKINGFNSIVLYLPGEAVTLTDDGLGNFNSFGAEGPRVIGRTTDPGGWGTIAANTCIAPGARQVNIPGAIAIDLVILGQSAASFSPLGIVFQGYVTSPGVVQLVACNITTGAVTVGTGSNNVMVIRGGESVY